MINDGINNVPENTIALFPDDDARLTRDIVNGIIKKSTKKREWFHSHFYRCLPLTIGNQYGFTISSEFDIKFLWSGDSSRDEIYFTFFEDKEELSIKYPRVESHFGHGVITIAPPFMLRTPPGVNLMTINPTNHIIPNITVMTGVVETDNIRTKFTFNLKIQIPNVEVFIPKGTPLAAFIPIPRNYVDKFELKFADDLFGEEIINEENQAHLDALTKREEVEIHNKDKVGRDYFLGKDVYGNEFKNHQKP